MDIATVKKDLENQIGSINEDLKNIYLPLEAVLILLGKRTAFQIALESIGSIQQEQPEGLHFTPLNRLIQKIPSGNWNDTVNNYAKKLRDCLIKEGYRKDAKVLQGYISYMNGNNVPMATMDEQEQPQVAGASKMEQPVEGLEELRKEVIKFSQDHFDELHSDMETIDIVHIIACHFAEWGAEHARKEE